MSTPLDESGSTSASHGPGPQRLGGAIRAAALLGDALTALRRHRSLWPWAVAPVLLGAACVSVAVAAIVLWFAELRALTSGFLPSLVAGAWYEWLWIGPGTVILWLVGWLLFSLAVALVLAAAVVVTQVLAAPFLDVLSQRVERLETGAVLDLTEAGIRGVFAGAARSIRGELQRALFFLAVSAVLWLLGLLVPGAQLVTPLLWVVFTVLFMPLEYSGFVLDRRQVSFRARRAWVREHWSSMAGFGGVAFVSCLVPGLNFFMLPVLVAAGTLLALRLPQRIGPS